MSQPAVGLLDTNILVDIWRGYTPAVKWVQSNPDLSFAVPSLVRMEMILGVQNKSELEKVIKLLSPFPIVYPSETDAQWAMEQFETHYLRSQIEIIDCFIAAIGVHLGLPLYSRNTKDYRIFEDLVIAVPY